MPSNISKMRIQSQPTRFGTSKLGDSSKLMHMGSKGINHVWTKNSSKLTGLAPSQISMSYSDISGEDFKRVLAKKVGLVQSAYNTLIRDL